MRTWNDGSARSAGMSRPALILGRRRLEHVLRAYVRRYNHGRPHRALDLKPPDARTHACLAASSLPQPLRVNRRDVFGGVINECELDTA